MVWKKLTTEEFISRSVKIHGDKYDYSEVEYTGCYDKVKIYCKAHKKYFMQSATTHLSGSGCKRCGDDSLRKSTNDFIKESIGLFGDVFDYSDTVYHSATTSVRIRCRKHDNDISISPNKHLLFKYGGCNDCSNEGTSVVQRDNVEEVINKINKVHGDKFLYHLVDYKSQNHSVTLVCKDHGPFSTQVSSILAGHGCPACAKYGFDKTLAATLYVLSICGAPGNFVGYGITNDIEKRLKTHNGKLKNFGFSIKDKELFYFNNGEDALTVEYSIKQLFPLSALSSGIVGFKTESTTSPVGEVISFISNMKENMENINGSDGFEYGDRQDTSKLRGYVGLPVVI